MSSVRYSAYVTGFVVLFRLSLKESCYYPGDIRMPIYIAVTEDANKSSLSFGCVISRRNVYRLNY